MIIDNFVPNEDKRLPAEFKVKFLEALRSGKYEQGSAYLYNGHTYCCIGVAGAICGVPLEVMKGQPLFNNLSDEAMKVARELGVPELLIGSDGRTHDDSNEIVLILVRMNDGCKTFPEIADWTEENL